MITTYNDDVSVDNDLVVLSSAHKVRNRVTKSKCFYGSTQLVMNSYNGFQFISIAKICVLCYDSCRLKKCIKLNIEYIDERELYLYFENIIVCMMGMKCY